MKNLSKFLGIALIFGAMIVNSCAMDIVDNNGGSDDTDVPSGYTQVVDIDGNDVDGLFGRESSSGTNVTFKLSMPSDSCFRYMASDNDFGGEFDSSRASFSSPLSSGSERATKTTGALFKRNLLIAFWADSSDRSNWDKAKFIVLTLENWVLKTGYTQAKASDGVTTIAMGYKVDNKTFVSDFATGGRLIMSMDYLSRNVMVSDNTDSNPDWVDYTFDGNGIDTGNSPYVNWAYWSPTNNAATVAALDWSLAAKGTVIIDVNKTAYDLFTSRLTNNANPTLTIDGIRMFISSTSGNRILYVNVLSGSTAKYVYSDYNTTGYPDLVTGAVLGSSLDTTSVSSKYILVTYWPRGVDTTSMTGVFYGYYAIGSSLPLPVVKGPNGATCADGGTISMLTGQVVTFSVSASLFSEVRVATFNPLTNKGTVGQIFVTESGGEISGQTSAYGGGLSEMYVWGKGKNGEYSNVLHFTMNQASVPANPVTSVTISVTTLSMQVGSAPQSLVASVLPSNANNTAVNWATSNIAVATVSSTGVVTPVSIGTATITLTAQDTTAGVKTATCSVSVTSTATITKVNLKIDSSFAGKVMTIMFPPWTTPQTVTVASDGRIPLAIDIGQEFSLTYYYNNVWMDITGVGVKNYVSAGWTGTSSLTMGVFNASNSLVRDVSVPLVAAQ